MAEFVIAALRATPRIGRIALVGPHPLPAAVAAQVDIAVRERGELLENVGAGLEAIGGGDLVLAAAADIPLLTARAVDAFLDGAAALEGDIWYAAVPHDDVTQAYPHLRKTTVRLRDGAFTGGSLVLLRPQVFARVRPLLERAAGARKRPWELARLFGPGTLVALAAGRLRIADLEERVVRLAGVRARAVICRHPEIAIDVDRPETLAAIRDDLEQQAALPR